MPVNGTSANICCGFQGLVLSDSGDSVTREGKAVTGEGSFAYEALRNIEATWQRNLWKSS